MLRCEFFCSWLLWIVETPAGIVFLCTAVPCSLGQYALCSTSYFYQCCIHIIYICSGIFAFCECHAEACIFFLFNELTYDCERILKCWSTMMSSAHRTAYDYLLTFSFFEKNSHPLYSNSIIMYRVVNNTCRLTSPETDPLAKQCASLVLTYITE
jgi:hypothetical protein